jgi:hypothetical protein
MGEPGGASHSKAPDEGEKREILMAVSLSDRPLLRDRYSLLQTWKPFDRSCPLFVRQWASIAPWE